MNPDNAKTIVHLGANWLTLAYALVDGNDVPTTARCVVQDLEKITDVRGDEAAFMLAVGERVKEILGGQL